MTNPGSCRTKPVQMDESVHGSIVEREMSVNAGKQLRYHTEKFNWLKKDAGD